MTRSIRRDNPRMYSINATTSPLSSPVELACFATSLRFPEMFDANRRTTNNSVRIPSNSGCFCVALAAPTGRAAAVVATAATHAPGVNPSRAAACATVPTGSGCPDCAGTRATTEHNLAAARPDLAREWHPDRNANQRPDQVTPGSTQILVDT